MPLQIIDYSRIPVQQPDYSGLKSIIPGALEGFKSGTEMKQTKEQHEHEKKAAELVNAIKEKYGEQQAAAELALTEAQAAHHARLGQQDDGRVGAGPGRNGSLTNFGKGLREREEIAEIYGEDSPQVKLYDDWLAKTAGKGRGSQSVPNPVKTKQINSMIANKQRQYFAENLEQPYVGQGSILQLRKDKMEYSKTKDPTRKAELADKLARAALAERFVPEYAGVQLTGQGIQPTVAALKHQSRAIKQGWPETLHAEALNLPPEVQELVNKKHAEELAKLANIRTRAFEEASSQQYFNPENQRALNNSNVIKDLENQFDNNQSEMITIRNPRTGEVKQISKQEALSRGIIRE